MQFLGSDCKLGSPSRFISQRFLRSDKRGPIERLSNETHAHVLHRWNARDRSEVEFQRELDVVVVAEDPPQLGVSQIAGNRRVHTVPGHDAVEAVVRPRGRVQASPRAEELLPWHGEEHGGRISGTSPEPSESTRHRASAMSPPPTRALFSRPRPLSGNQPDPRGPVSAGYLPAPVRKCRNAGPKAKMAVKQRGAKNGEPENRGACSRGRNPLAKRQIRRSPGGAPLRGFALTIEAL